MVEVEIDNKLFNIDDKPTLEKYNEVMKQADQALKDVRKNVYNLFLGFDSLKVAISLLAVTFIITYAAFKAYLYNVLFFETLIYFLLCVALSELFTREIKSHIQEEIRLFKDKYASIIKNEDFTK